MNDQAQADCRVRVATPGDIEGLVALFVEMNRYYDDPPGDEATIAAALRRYVFAPASGIELLAAESDGWLVGFASLSLLFPVDGMKPALYLKELFVSGAARSGGVGRRLLVGVARLARERGCIRVNWMAATDNPRAIRFYEGIGATGLVNACSFELDAKAIAALLDTADS